MICNKCGKTIQQEGDFCPFCGQRITAILSPAPPLKPTSDTDNSRSSASFVNKAQKHKLAILIVAVLVVGLIWLISHFNSPDYIKKKMAKHTWYGNPLLTEYHNFSGCTLKLYLNGESDRKEFYQSSINDEWIDYDYDHVSWDVFDDKTLYFEGKYYKWNEDWYLLGNTLKIGDRIFYTTNNYGYDE